MEQLRAADLRGALELVGQCEGAADLPAFGRAVLGIARLLPGVVAFNEIDLARGSATVITDPAVSLDAATAAEFARLAHQNPLVVHGVAGDPPTSISDLLSARSFGALEIHDVVFAPYGFRDQLALHLRTPAARVAGIAINRERRGFTARERALLELLAPHLAGAYERALERERARALGELAGRGLAARGLASVLIGPGGGLQWVDGRAEEMLRRHFPGERPDELRRRLRDWALSVDDDPAPLHAGDGQGRRLRATRLDWPQDPDRRLVILDEWDGGPSPQELCRLGLTGREAEVLAWAAGGRGDAEIGRLLGISPRTVDKHLEHVFRKLGARNRAEAVAKAHAAARRRAED